MHLSRLVEVIVVLTFFVCILGQALRVVWMKALYLFELWDHWMLLELDSTVLCFLEHFSYLLLILSFFIFYFLLSLSSFNLNILSSIFIFKSFPFLLNLYLISYLSLSIILLPYLLLLNWVCINLSINKVRVDLTLGLLSTRLLITKLVHFPIG